MSGSDAFEVDDAISRNDAGEKASSKGMEDVLDTFKQEREADDFIQDNSPAGGAKSSRVPDFLEIAPVLAPAKPDNAEPSDTMLKGKAEMSEDERARLYQSEAQALLWDGWNEDFSKGLARNIMIDRNHPDMYIHPQYRTPEYSKVQREVKFDFTVGRDGKITDIKNTKASGSAYFDRQVKKAIQNQSGMLKFPENSQLDERTIHYRYGWNVGPAGVSYPTGQIEVGGELSKKK